MSSKNLLLFLPIILFCTILERLTKQEQEEWVLKFRHKQWNFRERQIKFFEKFVYRFPFSKFKTSVLFVNKSFSCFLCRYFFLKSRSDANNQGYIWVFFDFLNNLTQTSFPTTFLSCF